MSDEEEEGEEVEGLEVIGTHVDVRSIESLGIQYIKMRERRRGNGNEENELVLFDKSLDMMVEAEAEDHEEFDDQEWQVEEKRALYYPVKRYSKHLRGRTVEEGSRGE